MVPLALMCRIISLMNKIGVVGSSVLQQILLLVTSSFGAGKHSHDTLTQLV
jgi:hypothetical protein